MGEANHHQPEPRVVHHVECGDCGSRLGLCIACNALVCKAGGRNRCRPCSDHRSTAYTRVRQRQDKDKPVCTTCGGWPHDGPCPTGKSYFPDTCQHDGCDNPIWCDSWRDRLYCRPEHAPDHGQDADDEAATTGGRNGEADSNQVEQKPPGGPPCPGCDDPLPRPSPTSNMAKCEACDEYHIVKNGRVVPWPSS